MKYFRELAFCRICGGEFEQECLSLKDSPLANELYSDYESALTADIFPLEIVMCRRCSHIQLHHIVSPERLFSNYVYASGTSLIFREHFHQLALRMSQLVKSGKILEIGSNDGTLMDSLVIHGFQVVGIEPSATLAERCIDRGLEVHTDFLNDALALKLRSIHKKFDVVIGNNVFAHIDDLPAAFGLVQGLLSENGFFVFEVAHSLTMVNELLFDTIYHEHMSYHSVRSLVKFMPSFGFDIVDIEEIPMHGGSIRVISQKVGSKRKIPKSNESIQKLIIREAEANLDTSFWMEKFKTRLLELKSTSHNAILAEGDNVKWFGYGAPAKTVTFINEFKLDEIEIVGIVDDNIDKQGKYLPRSGIKIMSRNEIMENFNQNSLNSELRCIIFPWNLSTEIEDKLMDFTKHQVKLIWFLPKFKKVNLHNENVSR